MPVFKIMRIYEVSAESQSLAVDRMMDALTLGLEKDFHVMDFIKSPEDAAGKGKKVSLVPPKGWGAALLVQMLGRSEKK